MAKKFDFDYIIIGGGPAGITAALTLAKSKKRIAIIEKRSFGGNNLAIRDVPYAVGLDFAQTFSKLANYPEINRQDLHYNFPTIASHQNQIISLLQTKQAEALKSANVTYIQSDAHFINAHTVSTGDTEYTAGTFILATGTVPSDAGIIGLDTVGHLTPDSIIKARRLPKYALIIGGGSTGCEIAEYLAKLGSKVILMEKEDRILPVEDKEVSSTITDYFAKKLGIMVMPNTKVVALEQDSTSKKVVFVAANGQEKTARIDCIVLAAGSLPATDCGLENAGVKYTSTGIMVNKNFQTSAKHIYAIGDCLGGESSTERAEHEATVLGTNLLTKSSKNLPNYNGFIRVTNTYPEIATVGYNETSLTKLKRKHKKSIVYLNEIPASNINQLEYGFIKIITDHNRRIIGATIVAPGASLMAEEFSIAIRHKLTPLEIASTPHIANSFNYAIKLAAKKLIK